MASFFSVPPSANACAGCANSPRKRSSRRCSVVGATLPEQASAVPGYVDYAVHRGATLMIDIESGRFVFFYRPVDDF